MAEILYYFCNCF